MKKGKLTILYALMILCISVLIIVVLKDFFLNIYGDRGFLKGYFTEPINSILLIIPLLVVLSYILIYQNIKSNLKSKEERNLQQQKTIDSILEYTTQLMNGVFDSDSKLLTRNDKISETLHQMLQKLIETKEEEEERNREEAIRKWIAEGMAHISNLFRLNYENINTLTYEIIVQVIKYLEANQGGVFLIRNDDENNEKFLELVSCFAYDRKKYLQKKVLWGEGLIGACALESETIYFTELPDDYIAIGSGLGDGRPNSLIIVPIKYNDEIIGVFEIASFQKLEKHKREFLEKVAENIASAIIGIQNNERTKRLLEIANANRDDLKQKEEEIRQNMEEMEATKEEVERKEAELRGLVDAMNRAVYRIEYSIEGVITDVNKGYTSVTGLTKEEMIGLSFFDSWQEESEDTRKEFWNDVLKGKTLNRLNSFNVNNKIIWLSEYYTSIYDQNNEPLKVLKLAFNITEFKKD